MSTTAALLSLIRGIITRMKDNGYDTDTPVLQALMKYSEAMFEDQYYKYIRENPDPLQHLLIRSERRSLRALSSHQFVKKDDPEDRCLVYFAEVPSTRQVSATELCMFGKLLLGDSEFADAILPPSTSGIIVTPSALSAQAATRLADFQSAAVTCDEELKGGPLFVQHYLDDELMYNPTVTKWGSETKVLSSDEAAKFLAQNKLRQQQMPKQTTEDPISKYYRVRPDQILELTRTNVLPETLLDEELYYRAVFRKPPEKKKSSSRTTTTRRA